MRTPQVPAPWSRHGSSEAVANNLIETLVADAKELRAFHLPESATDEMRKIDRQLQDLIHYLEDEGFAIR